MKRYFAVLAVSGALLLVLQAAGPQTIRPGEIWPDDRGRHIQAHGGGILKVGDTYYWFGEDRSQDSTPPDVMSVVTPRKTWPTGASASR